MFEWASQRRYKFATEHEYPYLGQNDWCKNESLHGYEEYVVTERQKVPPNNIVQMKRALMKGPVTVGVNVPDTFIYY